MKKTLLFTCLSLLFTVNAQAQYGVETNRQTGKKGLVDPIDGTIILPFEYDNIQPAAGDSLVVVSKDKKMGAFDLKGRPLVPLEYSLLDFTRGRFGNHFEYAAVSKEWGTELWGLIDRQGKIILPLQFEYVEAIFPDLLVARAKQDSVLQFFNASGKPLFTQLGITARRGFDEHSVAIVQASRRYFFVQKTGEPFFENRYQNLEWTDGQLVICGQNFKQGIINISGDTILPFIYNKVSALSDDNFLVEGAKKTQGVVNRQGQFILPLAKQKIQKWRKEADAVLVARSDENNRANLYDRFGKLLVSNCYVSKVNSALKMPPDNTAFNPSKYLNVTLPDNTTGLFHADGRQILPIQFSYINYCSDRHLILASTKTAQGFTQNRWIVYNWEGKQMLPDQFRLLEFTYNPNLLYGMVDSTLLYGFIRLDKPEKTRYEFERLSMLNSGYFVGLFKNRWQLLKPDTKPIKIESFDNLLPPARQDFEQFRKQKLPGQLIAVGYRKDSNTHFAINEKGKSFQFDPLPAPEIAMEKAPEVVAYSEPKFEDLVIEVPPPPATDEVYQKAETLPAFPGGEPALLDFIAKNLKYPALARENRVVGKVVLRFVVEKDGSLNDIIMLKDIGAGCGKEAIRMVQSMPKWIPGMQDGRAVRTYFTLPVEFRLD